jgi:hypothetical protein
VTAFAMARKLNSLAVVKQADVAQVPGGTVGVGVRGLTPLMLGFLVAVAAVLCGGKVFWVDKFTGVGGHEGRQEMSLVAETVVILFRHLYAVGSSCGSSSVGFATGNDGADRQRSCQGEREIKCAHDYCRWKRQSTGNPKKVLSHGIRQLNTCGNRVDDTEFVQSLGRTTKYEIRLLLLEESAGFAAKFVMV